MTRNVGFRQGDGGTRAENLTQFTHQSLFFQPVFQESLSGNTVLRGGQATTDRESRKKPVWVACEHIIYEDV